MTECSICKRDTPHKCVERHHLIPCCRNGKGKETIFTCIDCGNQIHQLFTNKDLDKKYNTLEKLLNNPKIQKWKEWVKNKKFGICMKTKKRK